jgi:hypothetical protein
MKEYSSSTFKKDNAYLTGVKIILAGWNLTAELVKIWVETINCGPAPPALWNFYPVQPRCFFRLTGTLVTAERIPLG